MLYERKGPELIPFSLSANSFHFIGLLKADDKPQPLNTIDSKMATIKRKIMNA